ncbi:MAG: BolA family transcriptional regulator [Burkholderiales bacterium]|nr:BolA family transcriptional regulator [Burkholderiales bacterium]
MTDPASSGRVSIQDRIRQKLACLAPSQIEIADDSDKHAGHAGARDGGGHYRLLIVSPEFSGKRAMTRHRLVYDALGDLMHKEIHALAIQAYAPEEAKTSPARSI